MLLAGSVDLDEAVAALREERQVFHSESDFQHALAWTVHLSDAQMRVRLETRPAPGEHLDLLLSRSDIGRHTAIELKYLTAAWSGDVAGEAFGIKNHGAQDVRGYDVVDDIERVERFVDKKPGWNGAVIVLTNEPSYWRPPVNLRDTNASAFRLYEGVSLSGVRAWGPLIGAGTKRNRERPIALRGTYTTGWTGYSQLPGPKGTFRLLILRVEGTS